VFYSSVATHQMLMTVMIQHLMCVSFSVISDMKSGNDYAGIRIIL